ncbi:MAG: hypothetical protein VSS52_012140 [Thiotrichaceae bacterium]|nr:hypothetical protein [Thiotrichaceae bacterium]
MTLQTQIDDDAQWMIDELGIDVTYSSQADGAVDMKMVFTPNCSEPPTNVGYSDTVSKRWHQFTGIVKNLGLIKPKNGDTILDKEKGITYRVDHVMPYETSVEFTVVVQAD